ncbi:aminopeptidase P family N-terminal domain-containing protein (plasmid) [Rhizobium sp. C104]|uniref:aminopeptidase P family N-terminal domain-containing protein n=1 Tax=Rhizobium sp. C104 TaxID=2917727 RepID=UPI001EF7B792|nr:aminopeptidase P family N-terminal domain-containing protein [Rhizobium sp. C104]ULJ82414.1 aminopeptidase P family N-terminal domain-containing protein [Rhizobium sp. C104]
MIKELHFELGEFQTRLAAVKKEMAKRGIDILLLSEPPNQNYLTGYNAYSFYTPQMVVVAQDHAEPIWIGRFMDRVSASMTTYLSEDNIRAYPDTYVQSATLSAYTFMADIVKELGGEKARIGVEMGDITIRHAATPISPAHYRMPSSSTPTSLLDGSDS